MLKFKSIQFRILLSFSLLIVFAAAALSWVSYSVSAESITAYRMKVVGGVASMKRKLLVEFLSARQKEAEDTLASLTKSCFQDGAAPEQACITGALRGRLDKEAAIGILLSHPVKNYSFSIGMPPGIADGADFKQGQLAGFISMGDGPGFRPYLVKARDDKSGYRIAVLYPPGPITKLFDVPENLGGTGETFLADPLGFFITRPRYPSGKEHTHPISAKPMRMCLTSGDGETLDLDYRGEPVIHGFRIVPEIGGGCIMAHITKAEAFGILGPLKWKLALVAIGFILLSLMAAMHLSRAISRPITNITRVVRRMADGDFSVFAPVETRDEIGVLAFSFNSMINNLKATLDDLRKKEGELSESKKTLEIRVAEGNRELSDALDLLEKRSAISGAISKIAPVGHIVADGNGNIISSNPAAERMFGYEAGEMSGKNVKALAASPKEDEYSKYIRDYTDFKKTGLPEKRAVIRVPKELLAIKKNGEFFYISLYVREVLLSGEFLFIGIMEDITERREAKIALMEAYENNDAIMNASNETLALIGLEGNIIAINEAGAKRLNAPLAGLVGKSLFQILPLELAMRRMEYAEQAVRTGRPVKFEDQRGGKFFENTFYPVIDKNARVTRVALFATDITDRRQWENLLAERETKMRAILASTPDAVILIDEKGAVEMFNPAGARIFGWAAEDVIDQNIKILMPEPYQSGHDGYLENYLHSGEKKIIGNLREVSGLRKDGSSFPAELYVTELWLGKTRKFLGIVRDISGRKQAEEAIQKSHQSLTTAQKIAHIGSFDFNLSDYTIVASAELFRILGLAPVEGPVPFNTLARHPHPDEKGRLAEYLEEAMESGIFPDIEYRIVRMDGAERIIRSQAVFLSDGAGPPTKIVGTVLDVTELRMAEGQLRKSLLRYSGIIDHVTSVIYTVTAGGQAAFISKEAKNIIGSGAVSDNGYALWDGLVVDEDRGKYKDFRKGVAEAGGTRTLQYRIRKEDGSIAWLSDRYARITDDDGKVAYYQGIVDDITKLKSLEQLKDDFFHAVVHDLKSPITGIKVELEMLGGQIDALRAKCPSRELCVNILSGQESSMKQKVVDIDEGVTQLYFMIQSLLKLGEIEEEKIELHYEPFAMNDLLSELERDFRGRAIAKGLTMETRNAFMGTVIADYNLLKRVLQNLVDNAVKYSLPNTAVTVETSCAEKGISCENILISIANTGAPLTGEKINALFQKFKTHGHPESGSGIGLFFCHKTMALLGGGIYVDQDVDAITFHIFFPNG